MRWRTAIAFGLAALPLALLAVKALNPLPSLEERKSSAAPTDTDDTRIGRAAARLSAAHPGDAGVCLLASGSDAFAARMLLAARAERTLDAQYYIWRGDRTGTLLFEALRAAADRGVRVRLLLDDNNTSGLDPLLAALDAHANVEVRLFNPFALRSPRVFGYLTDFFRLNRRMHNKSFTADNQATIIGGRNVGDEYFDAAADTAAFVDLDALAIGPVVRDVSSDFDRYWASGSAYPAAMLLPSALPGGLAELRAAAERIAAGPGAAAYRETVASSQTIDRLVAGTLPFEWAPTRMISDDPAKGLGLAPKEALFPQQMREVIGDPVRELELVSPYFVPTDAGSAAFVRMAERGVRVRILVNSLAATDVTAVHSGYARHRKQLIEAGIALYEMRLVAPRSDDGLRDRLGSSATSLHAKTYSVDRARIFIGSFNFDPRSANLNTELGFVIESPALAARVARFFDEEVPARAYEVQLTPAGELYWTERNGGEPTRHAAEPATTLLRRATVWFLSLLPIESLL
jgi:putative cardiolipin synthase